jgi:hypothetical protein
MDQTCAYHHCKLCQSLEQKKEYKVYDQQQQTNIVAHHIHSFGSLSIARVYLSFAPAAGKESGNGPKMFTWSEQFW